MRIQNHTYEDSNYTFEMTIRTEHDPATVIDYFDKLDNKEDYTIGYKFRSF